MHDWPLRSGKRWRRWTEFLGRTGCWSSSGCLRPSRCVSSARTCAENSAWSTGKHNECSNLQLKKNKPQECYLTMSGIFFRLSENIALKWHKTDGILQISQPYFELCYFFDINDFFLKCFKTLEISEGNGFWKTSVFHIPVEYCNKKIKKKKERKK